MGGDRKTSHPVAAALLILVAALISQVIQIKFIPIVGMGPGFEALSVARSLAARGEFADPFDGPTGPTAHLAPGYPLVLAAIERMSPDPAYARFVVLGLTVFLHMLNVLLLYLVAGAWFPEGITRFVTAGIALAVPLYQVIPAWETMLICCGVLAFVLVGRRRWVLASGVLGGLLLLTNPSLVLILVPLAAWEWRDRRSVGIFLAVMLVVILPWEARNYATFHKLFFIRDNLGLELDVYNNDCTVSGAKGCALHPVQSAVEREQVRRMGEANYDAMRFGRVVRWMAANPGSEFKLAAERFAAYWFPYPFVRPFKWCISAVTLLSVWGMWCLWRDRHPAFWAIVTVSAAYPLVYYLVAYDVRYRYPILWMSILASAYGVGRLLAPEKRGEPGQAAASARATRKTR